MRTGNITGDGHVTGDSYFILDVPHLLHGVVIFMKVTIFPIKVKSSVMNLMLKLTYFWMILQLKNCSVYLVIISSLMRIGCET